MRTGVCLQTGAVGRLIVRPGPVKSVGPRPCRISTHISSQGDVKQTKDDVQLIGMLCILNECLKRATGRALVCHKHEDPVHIKEAVLGAPYGVVLRKSDDLQSPNHKIVFVNTAASQASGFATGDALDLGEVDGCSDRGGELMSPLNTSARRLCSSNQALARQGLTVLHDLVFGPATISEALCIPLVGPSDVRVGEGIIFDRWNYSGGAWGCPGYPRVEPGAVMTQEDVEQLASKVRMQADHVRDLKTRLGLTNQDEEVRQGVILLEQYKRELGYQQQLQLRAAASQSIVDMFYSSMIKTHDELGRG